MDGNGCGDGVVLGIDHGYGAVATLDAGIDDVDFIAGQAGGDGNRIAADRELTINADVDYIEHGDGAAAAIGDVGVLAVVGWVFGEVMRGAGGEGEQRQGDEWS